MLLLHLQPDARWDAASMARRLYLSDTAAADILEAAVASGLAERLADVEPTSYRFKPATSEMEHAVNRLALHYAVDIVTIAHLIHSRVDKRAQQFADAFRWRKET